MSTWVQVPTVLLFFIAWSRSSRTDLTNAEIELTLLLLNHFRGSLCVYALNNSTHEFGPARTFSQQGNYFLYLSTISQLEHYIVGMRSQVQPPGRSLVILKAGQDSLLSLRQISQRTSLSSVIWVMYAEASLNKNDFEGIYIPFDCEFIYVNAKEKLHLLTEIYQIKKTADFETSNFGFWTKDNGLSVHEEQFYRRRKSLKGQIFSAISGSVPPYVMYEKKSPDNYEFSGYFYEVWKELEYRINFGVQFSELDKKSGFLDSELDEFAVLPVGYDSSILDQMDITHPIYESRSYLFGHRPGSELEWDSYLKPFDARTWWASLAWMACSSAALALLYRISWSCGTSEREAQYFVFTFSESFATVFRAICNQGSNNTPRSSACRLLFLSIYLTALVVSSAFSAALFSLLTVPRARAPFNNFDEVISNKGFKIGSVRDSSIYKVLQDYTSKFPESIQNKLIQKVDYHHDTLAEGLNAVCRNKMDIMMCELPYVLYTMQKMTRECQEKVMPAGPVLLKSSIGFGLKKGSPYKELINLHVLAMMNDGITQRLLLKTWPPQIPSVQATWVRVTLSDISPILYMFGLGAILSIALLILEKARFLIFRKKHRKKPLKVSKSAVVLAKVLSYFPQPKMKIGGETEQKTKLSPIRVQKLW